MKKLTKKSHSHLDLLLLILPPTILLFFTGNNIILYEAINLLIPVITIYILLKYQSNISKQFQTLILIQITFTTYQLISSYFGMSFADSITHIIQILTITIWSIAFHQLSLKLDQKAIKYYTNTLLIASIPLSFLSFYFTLPFTTKPSTGYNLLYSTYGHNQLSSFLIFIIPIIIYKWITNKQKQTESFFSTHKYSILFIFTIINFFFTFSRSAFFALSIIAFLTLINIKNTNINNTKQKILANLMVFPIIFILILWIFNLTPIGQKLYSQRQYSNWLYRQTIKPIQEEGRYLYYQQAWDAFIDSPIIGQGSNTFQYINRKYKIHTTDSTNYAQNIILEKLSETGIVGTTFFLIFLLFLSISFHKIWKRGKKIQPFIIAIIATFTQAIFDTNLNFYSLQYILWAYISISFLLFPKNKNKTHNKLFKLMIFSICILIIIGSVQRIKHHIILYQAVNSNEIHKKTQLLQKAISIYPIIEPTWHQYFNHITNNNLQIHNKELNLVSILYKDNLNIHKTLANYYQSQNQSGEQIKTLTELSNLDSDFKSNYLFNIAAIYAKNNNTNQTLTQLLQIATQFTTNSYQKFPQFIPDYDYLQTPISEPNSNQINQMIIKTQDHQIAPLRPEQYSSLLTQIATISSTPQTKEQLLKTASYTSPQNSNFHLPILKFYEETNQIQKFNQHLNFCYQFQEAKNVCKSKAREFIFSQNSNLIHDNIINRKYLKALPYVIEIAKVQLNYSYYKYPQLQPNIEQLNQLNQTISQLYNLPQEIINQLIQYDQINTIQSSKQTSKLLYLISIHAYQSDRQILAQELLTFATFLNPQWGPLHEELLNLFYLNNNQQLEYNHIEFCKNFTHAKQSCYRRFLDLQTNSPNQIGFLKQQILENL